MSTFLCVIIVICIPSLVEPLTYCESGSEQLKCLHGTCQNDSAIGSTQCLCDRGWGGLSCDSCNGRVNILLTDEKPGYISDGEHNYTLETKCTWLISNQDGSPIQLSFKHFATECSWDHLYVYDGDSIFDPLVATYSGLVLAGTEPSKVNHIPDITLTSGSAFVHFYSDAAYNMSGFNISYRSNSCPKQCSGNGKCLPSHTCECEAKWKGRGCDIPMCPNNCSSHGHCSDPTPGSYVCACDQHFSGIDCSIPDSKGYWEQVEYTTFKEDPSTGGQGSQTKQDDPPHGRASHQSVLIDDEIWTVGGYDFNLKSNDTMTVLRYGVITKSMVIITPRGDVKPRPRYGHSLVVYQRHLVMYGGVIGKYITNELWIYNLSSNAWIPISSDLVSRSHAHNSFFAVVGHTAHLIDGVMYVVFGHSDLYGYMNTVQECNMSNYKWKVPRASGAIVKGGYGHTSVYDPESRKIYVYAGYHSGSSSAYHLSNDMYSYDPHEKHWRILRSSKVSTNPQYLHSAVLFDGLILVFGGNTHNDTARSCGAKCFSSSFLAYDIECDQWHTLDKPVLDRDIARFGHTAVMYTYERTSDNVLHYMHVFGGFNGLTLSDMYKYTPGNCHSHKNRDSCVKPREGVICSWVDGKDCLKRADVKLRKTVQSKDQLTCVRPTEEEMKTECKEFKNCLSCVVNSYNCTYCENSCQYNNCQNKPHARDSATCLANFPGKSHSCDVLHSCRACHSDVNCEWNEQDKQCKYSGKAEATSVVKRKRSVKYVSNTSKEEQCTPSCMTHTTCENCTSPSCMWCSSEQRCLELNAYVASFPYGQCMEWITSPKKCNATRCSALRTCEECQTNPSCGWCDDGTNTGLGRCTTGGLQGPLVSPSSEASNSNDTCHTDSWYFAECPVCQCNGHSTCLENQGKCIECEDFTIGSQCQYCKEGYYGIPTNGGNCTACDCNGQADKCNRVDGTCYCRTQGTTGTRCDECDKSDKYYGNPQNGGTCFYELATGYKFTFNMSKTKDWHYSRINFFNKPEDHGKDIEFQVNCSSSAKVNITLSTNNGAEEVLESEVPCNIFQRKFNHKKYNFGRKYNSTIYVYVFDFKTPFMVLVSFSQQHPIDLLHFFVTFFSCFLTLLVVAAVLWKVKQKYDVYRRNQRMKVTREQWANRPFGKCTIQVDPQADLQLQCKREPPDTQKRGAKSKVKNASNKPSYIAIQPVHNYKAAIVSVVFHLPTGDEDYAPPCQSGIAIGATVVSLGNNQRSLIEQMKSDKGLKCQKNPGPDMNRCPQYVV